MEIYSAMLFHFINTILKWYSLIYTTFFLLVILFNAILIKSLTFDELCELTSKYDRFFPGIICYPTYSSAVIDACRTSLCVTFTRLLRGSSWIIEQFAFCWHHNPWIGIPLSSVPILFHFSRRCLFVLNTIDFLLEIFAIQPTLPLSLMLEEHLPALSSLDFLERGLVNYWVVWPLLQLTSLDMSDSFFFSFRIIPFSSYCLFVLNTIDFFTWKKMLSNLLFRSCWCLWDIFLRYLH